MSGDLYILKGKIPVICTDTLEWAKWLETADRHVKNEYVGNYWVSTVFLGIDHNFYGGDPILFETMVFDHGRTEHLDRFNQDYHPTIDDYSERYSSWEEAENGHNRIVKMVRKSTMILIDGTKQ